MSKIVCWWVDVFIRELASLEVKWKNNILVKSGATPFNIWDMITSKFSLNKNSELTLNFQQFSSIKMKMKEKKNKENLSLFIYLFIYLFRMF